MIAIGFTGTRYGMTPDQRSAIARLIAETAGPEPFFAHHGDCIGADAEFHELCLAHPGAKIMIDLDELERIARAATQDNEQWHYEESWNNAGMPLADLRIPGHNGGASVEMLLDDAAHIAANSPATTLALIARIRELESVS
jgi:hypothetical protein